MKLSIPYLVNYIPKGTKETKFSRRPGYKLDWRFVTIHNTGNPTSKATGERGWLENPQNMRVASFHLVVDDSMVIECIPLNEVAWHAGTSQGNFGSIGIEICESGDYDRAMHNAVELTAALLLSKNLSVNDLRQHHDWSGKDCPWKIRHGHNGWTWERFKLMVNKRMVTKLMSKYFKDVNQAWQAEHIDKLKERGVVSGRSEDTFDPDAAITRAECAVVVNKAIDYVIKELAK